jgi:hypothetical protein
VNRPFKYLIQVLLLLHSPQTRHVVLALSLIGWEMSAADLKSPPPPPGFAPLGTPDLFDANLHQQNPRFFPKERMVNRHGEEPPYIYVPGGGNGGGSATPARQALPQAQQAPPPAQQQNHLIGPFLGQLQSLSLHRARCLSPSAVRALATLGLPCCTHLDISGLRGGAKKHVGSLGLLLRAVGPRLRYLRLADMLIDDRCVCDGACLLGYPLTLTLLLLLFSASLSYF